MTVCIRISRHAQDDFHSSFIFSLTISLLPLSSLPPLSLSLSPSLSLSLSLYLSLLQQTQTRAHSQQLRLCLLPFTAQHPLLQSLFSKHFHTICTHTTSNNPKQLPTTCYCSHTFTYTRSDSTGTHRENRSHLGAWKHSSHNFQQNRTPQS